MRRAGFSVEFGPADDNIPICHACVPTRNVVNAAATSDTFKAWEKYVSRVELSLPLKSTESESSPERACRALGKGPETRHTPDRHAGRWLPIRAPRIFSTRDGAVPRVRASGTRTRARSRSTSIGNGSSVRRVSRRDFKYGLEFRRHSRSRPAPRQIGLGRMDRMHIGHRAAASTRMAAMRTPDLQDSSAGSRTARM